ncbi:MAG TPA: BatA domain-containing protein [Kofleriaceae bacterium]|nr:BatA domain-containing protein [Kofleriaceae bacterium]
MSFLAPLMLIGALGLLVPIAIHLIGRRRAKVVRFAALEFLIGTRRRTARRLELRERLLLLVRAAVCLAVPLALAKPFTSCQTHGLSIVRGPQAAVLVVDDSFTAGYKLGDRSLLSRATAEAARILERLGPEAEVAVIRAAEGAPLPTELSRDHLRVRDALLALTPSSRPADLDRALSRAAQLLAGSNHQRRTVYLLAPLTVGSVHGGTPPWGADGPRLEIVDLRGDAALPNLAVTGLTVEPDASAGTRGVSVVAEIANHGPLPVHGLTVSLTIGNAVVARGQLDVAAGARQVKRFLATLPAGARSAEVMVEIPRDALPADDRRYALARLRDEIRVLVVDGDARADRREDEVFYLEAALRPGDRAEAGTVVTRITPDDLDDVHLDQFDVAILANVAALPAERVAALSQWVAAGGGLMVAAGDHVDPAAYEKTMTPLLPQAVRDPVDTGCASAPDECAARAWHLTKWEADHPIFAPFTQDAPGLAEASFDKVLLLGPTTDTADRKVLAHFTNGAAALVEARSGGGRLLLYTSTLDRDWNDLPLHPGFLPLMQEAVRHLARRRDEAATANLLVGQPASLPTLDLKRLEVHGPEGQGAVFAGDRLEGRRMIRFTATEAPGIYRVGGADQAGATRDRDELAFAVNLDPRGSDLTAVGPGALPPSGTSAGLAAHTSRRRVELWHALAAALLVLLLLESVLVQRR